jgi:TatD DNase family protein
MIDSHCHLNDERFAEDLPETLDRAREAGLTHAVVVGYGVSSSRRAVDIVRSFGDEAPVRLAAVAGVSTHEASSWNRETEAAIRGILESPQIVGLGETGLDAYYPDPPLADQERSLIAQIGIAREKRLPVVFHLRDAADQFFQILDREGISDGGVLHCFTGDERAMKRGIERGLFISYSGIVTFKKGGGLLDVARQTPLESILVETDAPYLAPIPHRGKRCEPAHVIHTAEVIARAKGITCHELEKVVERNLMRLFPRLQEHS